MRKFLIIILMFPLVMQGQTAFDHTIYTRTAETIEAEFGRFAQMDNKQQRISSQLFNTYEMLCIGEYARSLALTDKIYTSTFSYIDSLTHFPEADGMKAKPAEQTILQQAATSRVLILNENHNQPMHRVFAKSLLPGLYTAGYRYLAVEAVGNNTSANITDTLTKQDGFYLHDPRFGNFIKEAISLGFIIISYEATKEEVNRRDYYEALHLKEKVLSRDPSAKVFIYCGFDHGDETPVRDSTGMMAGWLKQPTGIDPVSFDQVTLTEHSGKENEQTSYSFFNAKTSCIFFSGKDSGETYKPFDGRPGYDFYICHPRTKYIKGRPGWLYEYGIKEVYVADKAEKMKFPLLALVYTINDKGPNAIPIDVIQLNSKNEQKPLLLKSGSYTIVLKDCKGKTFSFSEKTE